MNTISALRADLAVADESLGFVLPVLVFGYTAVSLILFGIRCATKGVPRDPETENRAASVLVGRLARHWFFWALQPLWSLVLRSGVTADGLTATAAVLGAAAAGLVGSGYFALGGWLFLVAGLLDALDGRLARVRGQARPIGAAIDSILDRYTDAFLLMGLAWYYRSSWVLAPVLIAWLGSTLVPYVRAKGDALGVTLTGGIMQRLERVLFLGGSIALSPLYDLLVSAPARPRHWLAIAGLIFVAATSNLTAIHRIRLLVLALGSRRDEQGATGDLAGEAISQDLLRRRRSLRAMNR